MLLKEDSISGLISGCGYFLNQAVYQDCVKTGSQFYTGEAFHYPTHITRLALTPDLPSSLENARGSTSKKPKMPHTDRGGKASSVSITSLSVDRRHSNIGK
jgi:hypothetical protein